MSEDAKQFIQWLFSLLGPVALAIVGWFWKQAQTALAMLKRHDEQLNAREKDLGRYEAMYQLTDGGKKAISMVAEVDDDVKDLCERIGEMQKRIDKVDESCESMNEKMGRIEGDQRESKTNIEWIKKELERKRHE